MPTKCHALFSFNYPDETDYWCNARCRWWKAEGSWRTFALSLLSYLPAPTKTLQLRTSALSFCLLAWSLESFRPHFFNRRSTRGRGFSFAKICRRMRQWNVTKYCKGLQKQYKDIAKQFQENATMNHSIILQKIITKTICKYLNLNFKMYKRSRRRKMTKTLQCKKNAKICSGM